MLFDDDPEEPTWYETLSVLGLWVVAVLVVVLVTVILWHT